MQSGKNVKREMKRETACVKEATSQVSDIESPHSIILTFGVFDGVHIAHQLVIDQVVSRARALGIEGVVITFDPHPALSISGSAPSALTTTAKKIGLLRCSGWQISCPGDSCRV